MIKNTLRFLLLASACIPGCGNNKTAERPGTEKMERSDTTTCRVQSPFNHNVGINYESWKMGREKVDVATDLAFVTRHFKLIKTFHDAAVGTSAIELDPTQKEVIFFLMSQAGRDVELIMGTNNSALAQGGYGTAWSSGLMTKAAYTDTWVDSLIAAFGSKQQVLEHLRCICLGNEVDANGPPVTDTNFNSYYTQWIPAAFNNLSASLGKKGLGSIPVTTIIANYPLGDSSSNIVAAHVTKYVYKHWPDKWNKGRPFVFFNQYTPDWGRSIDFASVIDYFDQVQALLGDSCQVFVGETGYSSEFNSAGKDREADVLTEVFDWIKKQQSKSCRNIPLCVFQAFDHPAKPKGQQKMGLFTDKNGKYAVKDSITIPPWTVSRMK